VLLEHAVYGVLKFLHGAARGASTDARVHQPAFRMRGVTACLGFSATVRSLIFHVVHGRVVWHLQRPLYPPRPHTAGARDVADQARRAEM